MEEEEESNEFGADFNLDFFSDDKDNEVDIFADFENDTRFIKPPISELIPQRLVKYQYAIDLAKEIKLTKGCRAFCVVNGNFIFGDLIEALLVENQIYVPKMTISTLSMSQNNIDSLKNLMAGGYIGELNVIVSEYFFAHERRGLIPYFYKVLDYEGVQLAINSTHCKMCIFETEDNLYFTIHGSANLRSSRNMEQFQIEENKELYEFNDEYQQSIIDVYKTLKKPVRGQVLWQAIQKKGAKLLQK